MTIIKTAALAVILAAGASTAALAAPTGAAMTPAAAASAGMAPSGVVKAQYYRRSHRRSYGTGYRGRGTRTGGPVGGLPSRN